MDSEPQCKYRRIKTGLSIASLIPNYGLCSFVGLISLAMLVMALFFVAPPFMHGSESFNSILNKGEIMMDEKLPELLNNTNATLNRADQMLDYHDKKINELEIKINKTIDQANVLLDKAMIDANKTEVVLDKILQIIDIIDDHWPFNQLIPELVAEIKSRKK